MQNSAIGAALALLAGALLSASGGTALLAAQAESAETAAVESVEGRWINPARSVIIAVAPCGEYLCGTVEWASTNAKKDARKGTDQLVGSQLLSKVRVAGEGRWQGRLFVPDANRHVHAKLQLVDVDHLKVSGCAIGRSLCKSQIWTRAGIPEQ